MAYVRRHWLSSVLYTLIIAFGLAIALTPMLFSGGTIREARAQDKSQAAEATPRIDPYLYMRVQKLRQELSLTTMDMAAMGCNEESATQILETLKTWCQKNQATLDQHHRDTLQAKAAIREAVRRNNVGIVEPNAARSLSELQNDLAKLYEQRKAMLVRFTTQLETRMDTFQRQTWQSAREHASLPAQLRYVPDLSDEQLQAMHTHLAERAPRDSKTSMIADELTWSQKQAVESVRINQATKATAVRNAEAIALPVPELLKEPIVMIEDVLAR